MSEPRFAGTCHIYQENCGRNKIPLCGADLLPGPKIIGGFSTAEIGLDAHEDPGRCKKCYRRPCAKCDEAARMILKKKARLAEQLEARRR